MSQRMKMYSSLCQLRVEMSDFVSNRRQEVVFRAIAMMLELEFLQQANDDRLDFEECHFLTDTLFG